MNRSPRAKNLTYKNIKIGSKCRFKRFISMQDLEDFARLTGDFNPLHMDEKFACQTRFKGTIVHGMLAASLFSTLVGMHCPGRHALILSQEISYMKPIRPGSWLTVTGEVTHKSDAVQVISISASISVDGLGKCIEGITKVKVMK